MPWIFLKIIPSEALGYEVLFLRKSKAEFLLTNLKTFSPSKIKCCNYELTKVSKVFNLQEKQTHRNIGVFPKCFTEFSDKNICHYSKRAQTCHLLCKKPACYHNTSKIHVKDRIFKLTPSHASVIYQIP